MPSSEVTFSMIVFHLYVYNIFVPGVSNLMEEKSYALGKIFIGAIQVPTLCQKGNLVTF
jgi:hypothetical protein